MLVPAAPIPRGYHAATAVACLASLALSAYRSLHASQIVRSKPGLLPNDPNFNENPSELRSIPVQNKQEAADMSRASVGASATPIRAYRPDLSPEIESALDALADLETRYEADRERLQLSSDPEGVKEALLKQLEARHARDRQPLIQRLAYLQRTSTTAKLLGSLTSVH